MLARKSKFGPSKYLNHTKKAIYGAKPLILRDYRILLEKLYHNDYGMIPIFPNRSLVNRYSNKKVISLLYF